MKKNFNREEAKYIYSFLIGKFTYLRETDLHLALKRNWTYLSAYIVHGQKTHLKHEMNNKSAIQSHTRINLGLCYIWQLLCVYFVVNIITICCLVWCVCACLFLFMLLLFQHTHNVTLKIDMNLSRRNLSALNTLGRVWTSSNLYMFSKVRMRGRSNKLIFLFLLGYCLPFCANSKSKSKIKF